MARGPELINRDTNERWRLTISMSLQGVPTITVIGMHTLYEVMGVMQAFAYMMSKQAMGQNSPDLIRELTKGGIG